MERVVFRDKLVEVEKLVTTEVLKVVEGVYIIENICNAIQFIAADPGTSTKRKFDICKLFHMKLLHAMVHMFPVFS